MKVKVRPLFTLGGVLAAALVVVGCGKQTKGDPAAPKSSRTTKLSLSARAARLRWNMATLTENYLQKGHHDAAWDEDATNALSVFAQIRADSASVEEVQYSFLATSCEQAVRRGCEDPMILYLNTRFGLARQEGMTDEVMAQGFRKAAAATAQYPCAWIRQFYICLRTAEAIDNSLPGQPSPEGHRFRRDALLRLQRALDEPDIPVVEAQEACRDLLASLDKWPNQYPEYFKALEPILQEHWPKEGFVLLLKGEFEINQAWRARGSGYADTVTEDGWKQFSTHLAQAAQALEKAWKLSPSNPKIAIQMMQVELGEGKGRKRMELWFDRAMALDPDNYDACHHKRNYLEPKWHGSPEEMIAFGRECVASEKWGGRVPLTLVDAHVSLAGYAKAVGNTNYWQQPQVWTDIRAAFEKFFALNPDGTGWRHNYAYHAFACDQWDAFNQQIALFGGYTNYSYFGGQDSFERMVSLSQAKAAKRTRD